MRSLLLATLALAALPSAAQAADSSVVFKLSPVVRASAVLPAAAGPGGVVLPVTDGTTRTLDLAGTVRIAGVRLTGLQAALPTKVTATVKGKRTTVFTLQGGAIKTKGLTVRLRGVTVSPAGPLAKRLGRAPIGKLSGDVTLPKPLPAFPRPASAVDVTSSTLDWHVRDSLVRYLSAGEGIAASAGATAGPKAVHDGTDVPLVYDFTFTPAPGGWTDAASGTTSLPFKGQLRLRYKAHGIDLRAVDPELRITGSTAEVVVTFDGRRGVLETLDLAGGTTAAPAALTAGGASLLAGFYPAGDPFGAMTFTSSTT